MFDLVQGGLNTNATCCYIKIMDGWWTIVGLTFTPFTDIIPDCSFRSAPLAQVFPAIPDAMIRFTFVGIPEVMVT